MSDTPLPPLAELRRAARAVRSRHPLAVAARRAAKQGGRGSARRTAAPGPMIPPASQNLTQKGSTSCNSIPVATPVADYSVGTQPQQDAAISSHLPEIGNNQPSSAADTVKSPYNAKDGVLEASLPDADTPDLGQWGDGSVECAVYCRPLNPRILLVTFPSGSHGRIVCHPKERARFCPGDTLWVKAAAGKDLYVLAGFYNRRGVRVR